MKDLEIGQVLSLKIRFNNLGAISQKRHPYLIIDIDQEYNAVEIAQIDSLAGKEYKAAMRSNKTIFCDEPDETVIDKDSYIQLDNTFKLEYFEDLKKFRRQRDKLSTAKLHDAAAAYRKYHDDHEISEGKNVYMDEAEIRSLNS